MFLKPEAKNKDGPHNERYPWKYDHDVIETGKSIDTAEQYRKDVLTFDSVAVHRGRNWTFENNKMNEDYDDRAAKAPKANSLLGVRFEG